MQQLYVGVWVGAIVSRIWWQHSVVQSAWRSVEHPSFPHAPFLQEQNTKSYNSVYLMIVA